MVVGDFTTSVETVVVGGGPGGYVAAIRAAQLGQEVVLVEQDQIGGVCLNWGCIPSKAMIEVSGLKQQLSTISEMGLYVDNVRLDLAQLHSWKNGIVEKLRDGIKTLLDKLEVEVVLGTASLSEPDKLLVDTSEGLARYEYKNVILATGSTPVELPTAPFDHVKIIDSSDALNLESVPKNLVVIGAGSVGLELAMVYADLGSRVTILEALDELLPQYEPEVGRVLHKSLDRKGIDLRFGSTLKSLNQQDQHLGLVVTGQKKDEIDADVVLVAVGRNPNTRQLGLDKAGVNHDENEFIPVNERQQTNVEHIFAIGDIVAGPMLAHRASHMGKVAAEVIAGKKSAFDNLAVPGVIFTDPEIAVVGLTEAEAKEQGYSVKTGMFPFRALGRALTLGTSEGFTKVISDADHGTVLGVHIVGPHASDLIAEGALAVESSLHIDDLSLTIHAHPTLPEGMLEAAEAVGRKAIHIFQS